MIVKLEGSVEVPAQTILTAYRGLTVLRTILKKHQLMGGVKVTDEILGDLEDIMPELPGLTALR